MSEALRNEEPESSADDTDATDDVDDVDYADPDAPGPGLPPPSAVESLVNALLEAGPEVAEHVVNAAQELLLAVQVIVDAADRAVQEQQTVRAERREDGEPAGGTEDEAGVRHLDLAD